MSPVIWNVEALADLKRLYLFLARVNEPAAHRAVEALAAVPIKVLVNPRLGQRLDQFAPREVRRILVGSYELRYEVTTPGITVLRIWHTREDW